MTNASPSTTYAEFARSATAVHDALRALGAAVDESGLEKPLTELMKLRASQLNGCAFCMHLHLAMARKHSVPSAKIDLVAVWRDTELFTDRERAALAWTEALTLLVDGEIRAAALAAVRAEFTEAEILYLTTTVGTINQWNRIAVGLGFPPNLTAAEVAEAR